MNAILAVSIRFEMMMMGARETNFGGVEGSKTLQYPLSQTHTILPAGGVREPPAFCLRNSRLEFSISRQADSQHQSSDSTVLESHLDTSRLNILYRNISEPAPPRPRRLPRPIPRKPDSTRGATLATMASMASDAQLFEDSFRVNRLSDPKYDKCDRLYCTSTDEQTTMDLDINNELFPCSVGDTLHVVIATSLSLDGTKDDEKGWRDTSKAGAAEATLADMFDYVMYGKIYKFEDGTDGQRM